MYRVLACFVALCVLQPSCGAPTAVNSDVQKLTKASALFSLQLYRHVALDRPTAIYSPLSAHTCLTMTSMGARGQTASEMKNTLQLNDVQAPHAAYKTLLHDLNTVQNVQLSVANGIWVNPSYPVKSTFTMEAAENYNATSENFDLSANGGPEAPINAWIANRTVNKIRSVLQPGAINGATLMVLVNTVYFNGVWESKFKTPATQKANFYKSDGSVAQVDMMSQVGRFQIRQSAMPGVDMVKIPFQNTRFAFYVALPRSVSGLPDLESRLTSGNMVDLNNLFTNFTAGLVELYLPKFNHSATMNLNNPLKSMGMPTAFSSAANFSGITDQPVLISSVIQKATIEVMETGTVAAAATVVQMSRSSAFRPPTERTVFRADHAFCYFLRDDLTGLILFQGKFTNPDITTVNTS
ncbi:uncharacterized protein LOC131928410 [Physella acuta]|uniref:uncharacterized protein LOC131928410 n=1 Tax=Physella acuta TaxID=109671 RepID=UPI0027DD1D3C|nr:uncharacterized protein LOC131928410 [Physella acuta]XP_059140425.1 uncharacterized protein LOC131928410 [Physella acuta]